MSAVLPAAFGTRDISLSPRPPAFLLKSADASEVYGPEEDRICSSGFELFAVRRAGALRGLFLLPMCRFANDNR